MTKAELFKALEFVADDDEIGSIDSSGDERPIWRVEVRTDTQLEEIRELSRNDLGGPFEPFRAVVCPDD